MSRCVYLHRTAAVGKRIDVLFQQQQSIFRTKFSYSKVIIAKVTNTTPFPKSTTIRHKSDQVSSSNSRINMVESTSSIRTAFLTTAAPTSTMFADQGNFINESKTSNNDKNNNTVKPITELKDDRTIQEITKLVAQRVKERNSWHVYGTIQSPSYGDGLLSRLRFMKEFFPKLIKFKPPPTIELDTVFPIIPMNWERINNCTNNIQLTWLGHASVLVQMDGCNIITDPVFSQRCSPSQWFGPSRYRASPCSISQLIEKANNIDIILISHNHYDHLDYNTIKDIINCCTKYKRPIPTFIVPLGLKQWFNANVNKNGILTIFEMDWYESIDFVMVQNNNNNNHTPSTTTKIEITCLPMKHWSNRIPGDRDQTLWCGYKVATSTTNTKNIKIHDKHNSNSNAKIKSFLFTGDTAWFDEMGELIGQRYGPFDVAAIPIGAYEPWEIMQHGHLNPQQAVDMKLTVHARYAVPIHWGTFPLTIEPVMEPREKLVDAMKEKCIDCESFLPWYIGGTQFFSC